jgi:hypothetical protein
VNGVRGEGRIPKSRSFGSAEKRFAQDDTACAGGDRKRQKQVPRLS